MSSPLAGRRLGLALSGGGVRAMAFHAGVLRRLAELGAMESVAHVSSVSGGSLLVGLVLRSGGYRWPGSPEYLGAIHEQVRQTLTNVSLIGETVRNFLFEPRNWRYALSRANLVAQAIAQHWDINAALGDLPARPIWSINGTTAENGRRFRFRGANAGDGITGYAYAAKFPLAHAMAMSSAYPVGIGPLSFAAADYKWVRRAVESEPNRAATIAPRFKRLHLYDGGVYDNLGLEPLWNAGSGRLRHGAGGIDFLLVADASARLGIRRIPGPLDLRRAQRLANIMSEQSRALRVRSLVNALRTGLVTGLYLHIGSQAAVAEDADSAAADWVMPLTPSQVGLAAAYPTTLGRMTTADFDLLSRHGYETMRLREARLQRDPALVAAAARRRVLGEEIDEEAG